MVRTLGTLRVGQLAPRSRYEGLDHVDEALRDDEVLGRQALKPKPEKEQWMGKCYISNGLCANQGPSEERQLS